MTALNEDLLSQYFDGELAGEEAEAVRRALEDDAKLQAKLEGLEHLHGLFDVATEARGDEVDSDALFARIEAKLADDVADDEPMFPGAAPPEEAPRPKLAVVRGGKPDAPAKAPAERPAPRRNTGLWIGIGATLAAAAALLLWVMRPGDTTQPTVDDGGGATIAEAPPHGSEIEAPAMSL